MSEVVFEVGIIIKQIYLRKETRREYLEDVYEVILSEAGVVQCEHTERVYVVWVLT